MDKSSSGVFVTAVSAEDLLLRLSKADIRVPARIEGRKTAHTESYGIARFLAALAASPFLKYPLEVHKSERPDFKISFFGEIIGIELTEAVPQEWAAISARHERMLKQGRDPGPLFAHRFDPSETLPKSESDRIVMGGGSAGWVGDEPEKNWAAWMLHAHGEKINEGYPRENGLCLLIYDNIFLPRLEIIRALGFLSEGLPASGDPKAFDRIFIESREFIWQWEGLSGSWSRHPIPPL